MMDNKRVTVVCCSNNKEKLQNELLESLSIQDESYDLIVIDNQHGRYTSCSAAFNNTIQDVKTKYVVFSHQDIILSAKDSLRRFVDYMEHSKVGDIYGVAGTELDCPGVLTAIYHGSDRRPAGKRVLKGIKECDNIDECFFGGLTETFVSNPFNEELCSGWHLYAVERCLYNRLNGNSVYVCEIPLEHTSTGNLNHAFYVDFRKLCKAYHNDYKEIYTTCERSKTNIVSRNLHIYKAEIKILIKRLLSR